MKHHNSKLIGLIILFILFFVLISQVIAEEEYEKTEGDDVEIEETTLVGIIASGKSSASPAQFPPQSFCDDPQRCKNIDEVWSKRIGMYINPIYAQQIWDPHTSSWKTFQEVYAPPPPPVSSSSTSPSTSLYIKFPESGKCFESALSTNKAEAETKLASVQFQGKTIQVNKIIKPLIEKINQKIMATSTPQAYFKSVQTGNWRCVRSPKVTIVDQTTCQTSTGKIARSKHSYGLALDINPADNEFCSLGAGGKYYYQSKLCNPTMPQEVINIFKANDFRWGGDWKDAKDYMHFDWNGNQGDFNGDGILEECGSSAPISVLSPPSPTSPPTGKAWEQYTASEAWADALTEVPGITGDTQIWKSQYNGKDDNLLRVDTGRDAILFIPSTTTSSKPIDIIYYFQGQGGFGLDMSERVLPQAKALANKGYNFIIVFPELPWSRGTFPEDKPNGENPRIKNRKSLAWDGADSDFANFHQEVIEKISTKYGIMYPKGKIFIIGHSNGGSAIGKAAEKGAFNIVKPDVITFSDAEYKWQSTFAIKRVEDSYTSPPPQINLLVQANNKATKEPTVYSIDYLNSKSCTVDYTTEKVCNNILYLPLTAEQTQSQGFSIPKNSKHRTGTQDGDLHALIGKMSIWWTVKNYYDSLKTT